MLNWITDPLSHATDPLVHVYNITFTVMTPNQRLWTIIALLALYQLVAIKWRLVDRNRNEGVPSSFLAGSRRRFWLWVDWRRNKRVLRGGLGARMSPSKTARKDLGGVGFGNAAPAGFNARFTGRTDLSKLSPFEANRNGQDHPDTPMHYKSSSQAGLSSFHNPVARYTGEDEDHQEE